MTRTVFVFPGQGSQHPGMAGDLVRALDPVRAWVDAASARAGIDIAGLLVRGTAAQIGACEVAQVAVFAVSVGVWQHLAARDAAPWAVMGHSAGEFAALVAAEMLDPDDALDLVVERSRAMAAAAALAPGSMVAIGGLPPDEVHALCAGSSGRVVVANENSPIQTVISGDDGAVTAASVLARQRGALRVDRLPVAGAFHSPAMEPARRRMEPLLRAASLRPPRRTFISSVSGGVVDDPEAYRALLCEQLTRPVRWTRAVRTARLLGATRFVEVGPGRVLSSLVRSCDRGVETLAANDVPGCTRTVSLLATPVAAAAAPA